MGKSALLSCQEDYLLQNWGKFRLVHDADYNPYALLLSLI